MEYNVAALVVTYNRAELLLECLDKLCCQSIKLKKILVVNNASTDNTLDLLTAEGFLHKNNVQVVSLKVNTGGAGGFSFGITKLSADESIDWIWIMDDDVEPTECALERILTYTKLSDCIQPSRFYEDGEIFKWHHVFDPFTLISVNQNDKFREHKNWVEVNTGCFEGMLISRKLAIKIPPPDPNFFISCDDLLYGFMCSLRTNVIYIKEALIKKKIRTGASLAPWKIYYEIRNRFWLKSILNDMGFKKKSVALLYWVNMLMLTARYITTCTDFKSGLKFALKGFRDRKYKT